MVWKKSGRKTLSIPKHEYVNGCLVRLEDLSFDQAEAVLAYKQRDSRLSYAEIALLLGFVDRDFMDNPDESDDQDDLLIETPAGESSQSHLE